ncbi:MAG: hypothetical protein DCC55_26825 [Chloroflexi bacterium]|nr:MAG: hypothetical protein DCC55_26825 [Chloroflexota bacterium]
MSTPSQAIDPHLVHLLIDELTDRQRTEVFHLQVQHCFGDVPGAEIEEDFFTEAVSRVLCYHQDELVGCAGTRVRDIAYDGRSVRLGGISGVCTHRGFRGQGIATRVCQRAVQFLAEAKCNIVFLSTSPMARKLYENLGFRPLPQGFTWENIYGQIKHGNNGMLAPVCSPEIAQQIWNGASAFHVGKGYW